MNIISHAAAVGSVGNRPYSHARRLCFAALAILVFFCPLSGAWAKGFSTVAPLSTPRWDGTATTLTSGQILFAGGVESTDGALISSHADLFDVASNTWHAAAPLPSPREMHTAVLLPSGKVLVIGGYSGAAFLASALLYDPATDTWSSAGSMTLARSGHTATLLPSGKVLVAGGFDGVHAMFECELYDPATNSWSSAGRLTYAHSQHAAVLLASGQVLAISGAGDGFVQPATEIYDPLSNTWGLAAPISVARQHHTATALANGKVLVAGGLDTGSWIGAAELYDPATNQWTSAGTLANPRDYHTATLLPSGSVLIIGGNNLGNPTTSAELYDPALNTWSAAPSLSAARESHSATLMPNGQVLIIGGVTSSAVIGTVEKFDPTLATTRTVAPLNTARTQFVSTMLRSGNVLAISGFDGSPYTTAAEKYDPVSNVWRPAGSLAFARSWSTATTLASGAALVTGGNSTSGGTKTAERYDPVGNTWSSAGSMAVARAQHTATLLPSGKVLVAGGSITGSINSAELYDPGANTWSSAGTMAHPRANQTATLLGTGKVLVAAGIGDGTGNGAMTGAELYDPTTNTWSVAGSLTTARGYATATLLASGKVLVAGGIGTSSLLASVEIYDPSIDVWSTAAPMSTPRRYHTATLLPNGKVLVAGGVDLTSKSIASTEVYDPDTDTWTAGPALPVAVSHHTGTLLANGTVLLAGGNIAAGSVTNTTMVLDAGLAPVATRQPVISTVNPFFSTSTAMLAAGSGFRPFVSAGSSNNNDSPTNAPVFQLQRIDNGQMRFVANKETMDITDSIFISSDNAFAGFPAGPVLVRTWVNGVPSAAQSGNFATAPGVMKAPTATGGTLQASVDFTAPAYDGGIVFFYTATASPGGATATCTAPCTHIVFNPLAAGSYTFTIKATNPIGTGTASPASNSVAVVRVASSVALGSDTNPSTFGQTVGFTATVTGQSPTGTVTFVDGADTLCSNVALAGGVASCSSSSLAGGTHNIIANYSGDASNATSSSTALVQTVNAVATQTVVSSNLNPSSFGQSVSFTATVTGDAPTGSVTFSDSGNVLCNQVPIAAGTAVCATSSLSVGDHPISAAYSGDADHAASSSDTLTQTVTTVNTQTAVSGDPNPSSFPQSVSFTATVTGDAPTGSVTFSDGGNVLCNQVSVSAGTAVCATSSLGVGDHAISAAYSGDLDNAASTSETYTQHVDAAQSTTTLGSSLNPSEYAQAITLTATVTGQTPGGSVTFYDNGSTALCTSVALGAGVAQCATSTLAVGTHSLTAAYSGDAQNAASTSNTLMQSVQAVQTTMSLGTTCMTTFVSGEPFTVEAAVSGVSPSGTVSFTQGDSTVLCANQALDTGTASCTTNALVVSSGDATDAMVINAHYNGDTNNQASDATPLAITVLSVDESIFRGGFETDSESCPIQ